MKCLVFFFLLIPLALIAKPTPLEEHWAEAQKRRYLSAEEFKKIIKNWKNFDTQDFELKATFKPEKKGEEVAEVFQYGVVELNERNPRFYRFNKCSELTALLKEALPFKTVGTPPYDIRYNNLFIIWKDSELGEGFEEECKVLVEENTFTCPEYTVEYNTLLSKYGPLVTYQADSHGGGGCGPPYHSTSLYTHDLTTKKSAVITDYFEEEDLFKALLSDSVVKEIFKEDKPKSLEEIQKRLELEAFAIFNPKQKNGRVRIRYASNAYECGMCTNKYRTLGLDVKPKASFLNMMKKLDPAKEKLFKDW